MYAHWLLLHEFFVRSNIWWQFYQLNWWCFIGLFQFIGIKWIFLVTMEMSRECDLLPKLQRNSSWISTLKSLFHKSTSVASVTTQRNPFSTSSPEILSELISPKALRTSDDSPWDLTTTSASKLGFYGYCSRWALRWFVAALRVDLSTEKKSSFGIARSDEFTSIHFTPSSSSKSDLVDRLSLSFSLSFQQFLSMLCRRKMMKIY